MENTLVNLEPVIAIHRDSAKNALSFHVTSREFEVKCKNRVELDNVFAILKKEIEESGGIESVSRSKPK